MAQGLLQLAVFCLILVAVMPLLGGYMAKVFTGGRVFLTPVVAPLERLTFRLLRVDPARDQDWKAYARALILFSGASWLALYLILRTQTLHPFSQLGFHSGTWDLSFNTASSFVTNTNWQYYGGETTLTNFSQMAGLGVQNFRATSSRAHPPRATARARPTSPTAARTSAPPRPSTSPRCGPTSHGSGPIPPACAPPTSPSTP